MIDQNGKFKVIDFDGASPIDYLKTAKTWVFTNDMDQAHEVRESESVQLRKLQTAILGTDGKSAGTTNDFTKFDMHLISFYTLPSLEHELNVKQGANHKVPDACKTVNTVIDVYHILCTTTK